MILNRALTKMVLSIGRHLDMTPMLNHATAVFRSELHCSSSIVATPEMDPNGHWHMVVVHAHPAVDNILTAETSAALLPKGPNPATLDSFYSCAPSIEIQYDIKALILPLPDVGVLILDATHAQLAPEIPSNLAPIAVHLAQACFNCMAVQVLKQAVGVTTNRNSVREETYIDQLFENAQVGIIMAENDGTVMRINPEFENIFGYPLKACVGKNIDDIVAAEEDKAVAAAITHSVSQGKKHSFEALRRCKDGTVKHVAVMASPIVVSDQQVAVYAFYRDVTTQRQMEAELIKAKKLEATGKLAGGIAHDFNNLLSIVLGNIDLGLMDLPPKSPSKAPLALAKQFCLQAHDLTQKFITFSTGGQPIKKRVDMGPIISKEAGKVFNSLAVACRIDLSKDLWLVDIDPGQFRHVLSALFSNAFEAMPNGGEVVITGRNRTKPNGTHAAASDIKYPCVQLTIEDNGIGVTTENLPRLFDPYYSTKKMARQTGLGMGLAVAHSVVTQHGGHIHIESQKDHGTQVCLFIPAIADH